MRGGELDHLVRDFRGTRYFIISTNHESCRQHALRKMGDPRARPIPVIEPTSDLPQDQEKGVVVASIEDGALDMDSDALSEEDSDEEDALAAPCINHRTDDDDDLVYTNKQLHGPNVLRWSSSSEASSVS